MFQIFQILQISDTPSLKIYIEHNSGVSGNHKNRDWRGPFETTVGSKLERLEGWLRVPASSTP